MKKLYKTLIMAALIGSMSSNCMAKEQIGILYNGDEMNIQQEIKVYNNVVMLPLRAISENLGYKVEWDKSTGKINIVDGNYVVSLEVGNKEAIVKGKKIELPVTPKVFYNTTYVPLRFISEAMEMGVRWDGKTKQVALEGKYTLDYKTKKLMRLRADGKKEVVAEGVNTYDESREWSYVGFSRTNNGSEIVSIDFMMQGAAGTCDAGVTYYIKDNQVIDQLEKKPSVLPDQGLLIRKNQVAISDGKSFRIYDDITGKLLKQYDLSKWLKNESFVPVSYSDKYLLGRVNHTLHIIDLVSNKVTQVLDYIPETTEDEKYDKYCIYNWDMPHTSWDAIDLVWETEEALVFKYHSETENTDKTITYMIGK